MASVNKVILIGNLGADPDLRYTQGGKAVAELRVATTFGVGDNAETEWHRVILWEKNAENAAQYLTKGKMVYIEGRIKTRNYDDKDGVKKYVTEIVAFDIKFLSPRDASEKAAPEPEATKPANKRGRKPRAQVVEVENDGDMANNEFDGDDPFQS